MHAYKFTKYLIKLDNNVQHGGYHIDFKKIVFKPGINIYRVRSFYDIEPPNLLVKPYFFVIADVNEPISIKPYNLTESLFTLFMFRKFELIRFTESESARPIPNPHDLIVDVFTLIKPINLYYMIEGSEHDIIAFEKELEKLDFAYVPNHILTRGKSGKIMSSGDNIMTAQSLFTNSNRIDVVGWFNAGDMLNEILLLDTANDHIVYTNSFVIGEYLDKELA